MAMGKKRDGQDALFVAYHQMRSGGTRSTGLSTGCCASTGSTGTPSSTPTRADLARLDRKRKKEGSNTDRVNPNDPDGQITKMKDGRTHAAFNLGLLMRKCFGVGTPRALQGRRAAAVAACVALLDRICEMLRAIGRSETAARRLEISSPWPAPELIAA